MIIEMATGNPYLPSSSDLDLLHKIVLKVVKQIKMLKRESKKTESSKIPTLLNVDQNQEKQEASIVCNIFPGWWRKGRLN
uniref:Cyclin-dependent kinase-like 3 n=1 Tax=Homo sapiens TaxID=9606 RepID=A0A8V8TQA6_HUMAN